MTPPPTTTTRRSASCSWPDPHREGVGRVEDQGRLGVDVGRARGSRAGPGRPSTRAEPSKTLPMMLSCRQTCALARACRRRPGRRAWRWCRCRRASGRRPCRGRGRSSCCRRPGASAGRTARCGRSRRRRRPVMPWRVERLADPPGDVGQALDVRQRRASRRGPGPGRTSCRPRRRRRRTGPGPATSTATSLAVPVARRRSRSATVFGAFERDRDDADGRLEPVRPRRRSGPGGPASRPRRSCRGRTCRGSRRC